jgi:hypothetical protein
LEYYFRNDHNAKHGESHHPQGPPFLFGNAASHACGDRIGEKIYNILFLFLFYFIQYLDSFSYISINI